MYESELPGAHDRLIFVQLIFVGRFIATPKAKAASTMNAILNPSSIV